MAIHKWLTAFMVAAVGIGSSATAQTVTPCPNAANCAEVTVGGGSGKTGDVVPIDVTFKQGPDNGAAGGLDEIAALAMTIALGTSGTPLGLADCTQGADGLPVSVKPDASIANFKVVVENAYCGGTRIHCLCPNPGSGTSPDNFLNLVIYGPNPLPTPGPNPIDIPVLPAGPQKLVTIDLKINAGATGAIPLKVYTESADSTKPQYTAFLSVGDKLAVDQTCTPIEGQPPCSAGATSQVAIANGQIAVAVSCTGDCLGDGEVTVDDIIKMVNIANGTASLSECTAGDGNGDGEVTIDDIIVAVNNALNGCPVG
ncbi:dockerin type I repeat-containing protein [Candidatus Binatia bacterium]|nr:dockerin type I repeat-containing protein [Candidatus Binatia bacterium]